jgi:uncharacterized membrane protein
LSGTSKKIIKISKRPFLIKKHINKVVNNTTMAKKNLKLKKSFKIKKQIKHTRKVKHAKPKVSHHNIKNSKNKINDSVDNKLNEVIALEKNLLKEEKRIENKENQIEKFDKNTNTETNDEEMELKRIEAELQVGETREETELDKLERLEKEIKKDVGEHPLSRITLKDFIKGAVGAFIGLAVHYTFTYGVEISEKLSITRATLLFPFTFLVGVLFIYATGFRKIKDPKLLLFIPLRLVVLYVGAIVMSIVVLALFYPSFGSNFIESYKMVAGVLLAAVVGACTADLFGKE